MKTCGRCKVAKALKDFCQDSHTTDGRQSWCRKCQNSSMRARRAVRKSLPRPRPTGEKICTTCHVSKPLIEFDKNIVRNDGRSSSCKRCRADGVNAKRWAARARGEPLKDLRAYKQAQHHAHRDDDNLQQRHRNRSRYWQARCQVIHGYGGLCACCGEENIHFLHIDHINGDGAHERLALGLKGGYVLYERLIKQAYPPGYRVLCANCNCARGFFGFCPHEASDPISRVGRPSWVRRCKVFDHYGRVCACCGEVNFYFLQIDHLNGGGRKHIHSITAAGNSFYNWLVQHAFPKGFRVLCANCNMAFGAFGFCPHQGKGRQLALL